MIRNPACRLPDRPVVSAGGAAMRESGWASEHPTIRPAHRAAMGKEVMKDRVLVVDDTADVRETIAEMFEDLGFEVIQASGGREALRVIAAHDIALVLLFTDIQMPGMDGQTLAAEARKLRPDLKVIFTSGLASQSWLGQSWIGSSFIAKPFRRNRLGDLVTRTLAG